MSIYYLQPVGKRLTSSGCNCFWEPGPSECKQAKLTMHKPDASKLVGTLESRGQNNSLAVTQQTAGMGTQTSLFPALAPATPSSLGSCKLAGACECAPLSFCPMLQWDHAVQSKIPGRGRALGKPSSTQVTRASKPSRYLLCMTRVWEPGIAPFAGDIRG